MNKRTNGPCTCGQKYADPTVTCAPECASLYPAQKEPDALTRLVRLIRVRKGMHFDTFEHEALALISEAREGQRKARHSALSEAAGIATSIAQKAAGYHERQKAALDIAALILEAKDSEP